MKPGEAEARDARRAIQEQAAADAAAQAGGKQPTTGAKETPTDGSGRGGSVPEDDPEKAAAKENAVPAWMTGLPPEVRDAVANPAFDRVPAMYQNLVRNYLLWLSKRAPLAPR